MNFQELIAALQSGNAPETIYDDLTASYTELSERSSSADSKIAQMQETIDALNSEVTALKGKNYDLLMQVGNETPNETEESLDDSETISIEDIFKVED